MKARIRVGSFHWVIVEQIKDPDITFLLAAGETLTLFGLSDEPHVFQIKRITPMGVDVELAGPYLVLVPENAGIGDGQLCTEFSLKIGESRKIATPTCDSGIVWDIHLEEIF